MKREGDGKAAGGFAAVVSTARHALHHLGVRGGFRALGGLNQQDGFDCPGCAWPDPAERGAVEFCENGAKAVSHEATRGRVTPEFFSLWPVARLLEQSDHWLEQQGRLTHPMRLRPGGERYEPVSWESAFDCIATHLRGLDSPDRAIFYTSGRTSNEAAFLYQLFVREFGTNNLPDCSNMCHESSGTGLTETIGVGKGTVSLEDFERADAIFVIGQNPGTNHPRMLSTLQAAKRRGCRIVAINPLRERGLVRFANPQDPRNLIGGGTAISDLYLQLRVGGDVALLQALAREILVAEDSAPGGALDWDFIHRHTEGFAAYRDALLARSPDDLATTAGISREDIREAAELYAAADSVIACWAMGITQHRNGVANVQEIMNLLLLRGNIGRPGAGPCPVRGHSNVQGDRTVGITERPGRAFLERLGREFGFVPPERPGFDTVAAIHAMHAGEARVFVGLGGNFAVATPDAEYTGEALRRLDLSVQIATKLNRSHLVTGREAILLPCLGRTEADVRDGAAQFVTVEDSMSVVHRSQGRIPPASPHLRSEPAIVSGIARAVLGDESRVPWEALVADYDRIRERVERVVPGFDDYNRRVRTANGFVLPSGARTRDFATPSGRARFVVHEPPDLSLPAGRFRMTTIRSHDQFNTTVYGFDDRLRGIRGDRRVVFLHPADLAESDLEEGQAVDLTSHFEGRERTLRGFRAVPYDLPRGCAATYFPEANPLVPVDAREPNSGTPSYKSLEISIAPAKTL